MLANALVHQRLGDHRLVGLVVPLPAETDQVDENVLVKRVAIFHRHFHRQEARLRIVAVDVKDRRLNHFRDVGAVERAASVTRVGSREADLVVDHDVDGAAGLVAPRLRQVEGLLHHALAGDGGVTVNQHWQHLVARRILAPVLACAHRALDYRVDDLEMRGIERQRQMHWPPGGHDVGRKSLVILDVTR